MLRPIEEEGVLATWQLDSSIGKPLLKVRLHTSTTHESDEAPVHMYSISWDSPHAADFFNQLGKLERQKFRFGLSAMWHWLQARLVVNEWTDGLQVIRKPAHAKAYREVHARPQRLTWGNVAARAGGPEDVASLRLNTRQGSTIFAFSPPDGLSLSFLTDLPPNEVLPLVQATITEEIPNTVLIDISSKVEQHLR